MHHVTGRTVAHGPYLDPALVIPLCVPGSADARRGTTCHPREHVVLRRLGLDTADGRGPLSHRVLRVTDLCTRLADRDRGLVLDPASTRALGALLDEVANVIVQDREVVA